MREGSHPPSYLGSEFLGERKGISKVGVLVSKSLAMSKTYFLNEWKGIHHKLRTPCSQAPLPMESILERKWNHLLLSASLRHTTWPHAFVGSYCQLCMWWKAELIDANLSHSVAWLPCFFTWENSQNSANTPKEQSLKPLSPHNFLNSRGTISYQPSLDARGKERKKEQVTRVLRGLSSSIVQPGAPVLCPIRLLI